MSNTTQSLDRRHDLDALRAFAMLLGIGLHACLSFFPGVWMVQDSQQNGLFALFFSFVHGFRMPLFFLVSGYFTQMLYRKRGLQKLLTQRTFRILFPFLLGLVTLLPISRAVDAWVMRSPPMTLQSRVESGSLVWAIRERAMTELQAKLDAGADPNELDPWFRVSPLCWAAMTGNEPAAKLLIERGAKVDQPNGDGGTPMHGAAFFGNDAIVALLLEKGANTKAVNSFGETPAQTAYVDLSAIGFVAGLLELPPPKLSAVEEGRKKLLEQIRAVDAESAAAAKPKPALAAPKKPGVQGAYQSFLEWPIWTVNMHGTSLHLMNTYLFSHLWFLWFLCWMVAVFAIAVGLGNAIPAMASLKPTSVSEWSLPWLVPLSAIPQYFMGMLVPVFGPDTSMGIIPLPHVFAYYGLFFLFGVLYYDAVDVRGRLGRFWWAWIGGSLPIFFYGLMTLRGAEPSAARELTNVILQVLFAWSMSIGMIGLFRATLASERRWVRYMSDASYWMYLVHVPLVVAMQAVVRDWPMWSVVKFLLINAVSVAILVATYHLFVRYTWLGWLLNGRMASRGSRTSREATAALPAAGG